MVNRLVYILWLLNLSFVMLLPNIFNIMRLILLYYLSNLLFWRFQSCIFNDISHFGSLSFLGERQGKKYFE